jgi:hypothetical protein
VNPVAGSRLRVQHHYNSQVVEQPDGARNHENQNERPRNRRHSGRCDSASNGLRTSESNALLRRRDPKPISHTGLRGDMARLHAWNRPEDLFATACLLNGVPPCSQPGTEKLAERCLVIN